jgi:hypothetical protein
MPKAVIQINYKNYVMELEEAMVVASALMSAKQYTTRGYGDTASHHVWEEPAQEVQITIVRDELVRIATIAGKPEGN